MSQLAESPATEAGNRAPMRELNSRKDSFGNTVQLLWDPNDNTVHVTLDDFDVEVPGDKARESYDDHLGVVAQKVGWKALEDLIVEPARSAE